MADRAKPKDHEGRPEIAPTTAHPRRVFVSYSSSDTTDADALVELLERNGIPCWIAPRDVKAGALYADAIVRAISNAKALVLVLSESAVGSSHVGKEVERASSKKCPIIALRIDNAPLTPALEYFLSESQWIEAQSANKDLAYASLISAIQEPERTAQGISPAVPPSVNTSPPGRRNRILLASVLAVVASAFAALLVHKFWPAKHIATELETTSATRIVSDKSIAVLPFTDMSEAHDQEYFGDGMAEEILDLLAKIPRLTVIGRTSSFQFKSRTDDLRTIGKTLGAGYVVEGSVRKVGTRIRVTAQLIDARSGSHVWSESYDRDFGEILTLQDEIATAIARALQLTIAARDARPLHDTRAEEAYVLYLKGKVALDSFNTDSLAEAQGAFQQALALNPTLLPAAEGVALTWMQRGIDENDITALEGWKKARSAAELSRAMDTNSATAHHVLGFVAAMLDFDWATTDREFQLALTEYPNDQNTIADYALTLAARGHIDQAISQINAALSLDPLNSNSFQALGLVLYLNRDQAAAAGALRKSLAINPKIDYNHYLLGVIQLLDGHSEEARKEFSTDEEANNRDAGLALVNHVIGKRAESDAALARLIREGTDTWPYGIATIYAFRGEKDKAFSWLDRAFTARDSDLVTFVLADPLLASLHDDPRWVTFLRKMNLVAE